MTRSEQDAEDVVQETFLRAYRRLKQFELRSSFGTWIFRIAVNAALDLTRKRGRYEQVEQPVGSDEAGAERIAQLPAADPAPDRILLSAELKQKVESVLAEMSPQVRAAFVLRHYEGMPIEQIGGVLGLKESATKNSIYRAVQKLRKELEPLIVASTPVGGRLPVPKEGTAKG